MKNQVTLVMDLMLFLCKLLKIFIFSKKKIKKDAVMYKKLVSFIELIYENHTNFCIYFNLGIPYSFAREEKFKEQCRRLRS
jgi:hypothetical protein